MGFMLEIPSLDERILTEFSTKVLFLIAQKQEAMVPARFELMSKHFKGCGQNYYKAIHALLNAKFIEEKIGVHSREAFTLTQKGWAVVGGKPMWMEA